MFSLKTLKKSKVVKPAVLLPILASLTLLPLLSACNKAEKPKEVVLHYPTPVEFEQGLVSLVAKNPKNIFKDFDKDVENRISGILQGAYFVTAGMAVENPDLNLEKSVNELYKLSFKDNFIFGKNFTKLNVDLTTIYGDYDPSVNSDHKYYYYSLVNPELKSSVNLADIEKAYQEDLGDLYPLASNFCKVRNAPGKSEGLKLFRCLARSISVALVLPQAQDVVYAIVHDKNFNDTVLELNSFVDQLEVLESRIKAYTSK